MNQQTTSFPERAMIDVLIVGAGPTGLTAALELARRGITFRLIEKTTQRSPYSKALALHARTLEILDIVRLLESLKPYIGETIRPYVVFEQGPEAIAHELPVTTLLDFKQQFHHKLGTSHGSILLVRPDGYVALHVPKLSQEQLLSELQPWVMLAQPEATTLMSGRA